VERAFFSMVQLWKLGEALTKHATPPPVFSAKFREIVQWENRGEESCRHTTPPPEADPKLQPSTSSSTPPFLLPEILQKLMSGLSNWLTMIPERTPFVTVSRESVEPVRSPQMVPSIAVSSSPCPSRETWCERVHPSIG
jgi:hypothetical protein